MAQRRKRRPQADPRSNAERRLNRRLQARDSLRLMTRIIALFVALTVAARVMSWTVPWCVYLVWGFAAIGGMLALASLATDIGALPEREQSDAENRLQALAALLIMLALIDHIGMALAATFLGFVTIAAELPARASRSLEDHDSKSG